MATTSLSLHLAPEAIRIILPAEGTPRLAYAYKDGERTDTPRVHADGWQIHQLREVTASILGEATTVMLETSTPDPLPAGAVLQPEGPCELRVRGTTSKGSDFAALAVTVSCPSWRVVGSIADALGLKPDKKAA